MCHCGSPTLGWCAAETTWFQRHSVGILVWFAGSVPPYYREVYEAIRCRTDERVQVEVFQRLLDRTDLQKAALGQVGTTHPDGTLINISLALMFLLIYLVVIFHWLILVLASFRGIQSIKDLYVRKYADIVQHFFFFLIASYFQIIFSRKSSSFVILAY